MKKVVFNEINFQDYYFSTVFLGLTKISDPSYDDGIGSSDDDDHSNSTTSDDPGNGNSVVTADNDDTSSSSTPFESDSSPNLSASSRRKKVLIPDKFAIDQLLAFDEVK